MPVPAACGAGGGKRARRGTERAEGLRGRAGRGAQRRGRPRRGSGARGLPADTGAGMRRHRGRGGGGLGRRLRAAGAPAALRGAGPAAPPLPVPAAPSKPGTGGTLIGAGACPASMFGAVPGEIPRERLRNRCGEFSANKGHAFISVRISSGRADIAGRGQSLAAPPAAPCAAESGGTAAGRGNKWRGHADILLFSDS